MSPVGEDMGEVGPGVWWMVWGSHGALKEAALWRQEGWVL